MTALTTLLLACKGPASGDSVPPTDTGIEREWVALNAQPCALDSEGLVECWTSTAWGPMAELGSMEIYDVQTPEPLSTISDDGWLFWGLSRETGLPVRLASRAGLGPEPVQGYTQLNGKCALLNSRLDCFDSYDLPPTQHLEFRLLGGFGLAHAGLTFDNELHLLRGASDNPLPFPPAQLDGEVLEVTALANESSCALMASGEVRCFGSSPPSFDHPPYYDLAGNGWIGCAAREPGLLDCSNGQTYDFGEPLRDFTVHGWEIYEYYYNPESGYEIWWTPGTSPEDEPHICVLTESNAIRCEGWRYDFPDLQAALPRGRD